MTAHEVKKKILEVKRELLAILDYSIKNKNLSNEELDKLVIRVRNLYNEYLKLYVQIDKPVPDFNNGYWPYRNNCYYYAMSLPTPQVFDEVYDEIVGEPFWNHLGSIANLPYQENFTKEDVLEYLYADLDALKIHAYPSEVSANSTHGGYKIALLVDENPDDSDYHFVRQNADGSWSEKDGFGCDVCAITTPEEFMNDDIYKYVKTLEIVKPTNRGILC